MSPRKATVSSPQPTSISPLRLDLGEGPLRIEMVEKPGPSWWQRYRTFVLAAILTTVFLLIVIFLVTFPSRQVLALDPPLPEPGFVLVLNCPPHLGLGDSGEIALDATNRGTGPLSVVRATLVFSDPLAVTLPITGSTVLDFGTLEPGEGKRRLLPLQQAARRPVLFTVQVTADGQRAASRPQEIPLSPVPYVRTLALQLIGAIVAWGPVTLLLQKLLERLIGK